MVNVIEDIRCFKGRLHMTRKVESILYSSRFRSGVTIGESPTWSLRLSVHEYMFVPLIKCRERMEGLQMWCVSSSLLYFLLKREDTSRNVKLREST